MPLGAPTPLAQVPPAPPEAPTDQHGQRSAIPELAVDDPMPEHIVPAESKRGMHPVIPFLGAVLLIVGVLVGLVVMKRKDPEKDVPVVEAGSPSASPASSPQPVAIKLDDEAREEFLDKGWMNHSTNTLLGFLRARTPEEKVKYVIGGEERLADLKEFYAGEAEIDEADTPIDAFDHPQLDIADKRRGLFMMRFERPSQWELGEFFLPVVPLEIQHNLREPSLLLSAFAARENFAMDAVRVMAFFKESDDKLLLDWDVYTQTKYRTLKHFLETPQAGKSRIFRVMITEGFPSASGDLTQERTFRLLDPAHPADLVHVPVAMESRPGQILSELAWIDIPNKKAQNRYATVKISWSADEEPQVQLDQLICWEFLGLGGEIGNADPIGETPLEEVPSDLDLEPDPLEPTPPNSPTPNGVIEAVSTGEADPEDGEAVLDPDAPDGGAAAAEIEGEGEPSTDSEAPDDQ